MPAVNTTALRMFPMSWSSTFCISADSFFVFMLLGFSGFPSKVTKKGNKKKSHEQTILMSFFTLGTDLRLNPSAQLITRR